LELFREGNVHVGGSATRMSLVCRPVAAQFMKDDVIALVELEQDENGFGGAVEKHYKLAGRNG
jgi:hypothetical protein